MPVRRRIAALVSCLAVAATFAVHAAASPGSSKLRATIRWTEHHIPHIIADDYAGIGYGYGYAIASDNICVLADTYVTVDAQRSRYFGPTAGYVFQGNGQSVNNLNSDFFFQQIIDDKRVEKLIAQKAPLGPRQEVRDAVRGYVAGYNRYLSENRITDPTCKDKPWVHPITEIEAYRRFYQLALLASSGVAIDGIGGAQPPTPSAPVPAPLTHAQLDLQAQQLDERLKTLAIGSNAVAVGSAGTQNHHGLLLGNPHFPWIGSERFYQAQLTIPGKLNVTGGSLYGVPIILIGHTDTMAWSHTVSTAYRFTPYQETLVPGSPTTYLYDNTPTPMTSRTVTVEVKQADGSLAKQSRTLWSTRHGSIMTSILGLPIFPWTPGTAFAMADANAGNFRYVNHFLETNLAHSTREELAVLKRNQGIPWVNTIVSDDKGEALYADISVTPHVTDAQAQSCDTAVGAATFQALRLPVLDGSRSACNWGSDPDSIQPGTFGPSHMPYIFRSDYVTNSNDSYWLANPAQPLTGFAKIIGDEGTARTLRTRLGLVMVAQRLAGKDGLPGKGFTRQDMQDIVFNDRQYAAELTRDALVTACRQLPGYAPTTSGPPVALGNACDVLAGWNMHDDVTARGALLFRRWWQRLNGLSPTSAVPGPSPWMNQFSASDPVNTPNTLNPASPLVRTALGDAINDLQGAHIPVDGALGAYQYEPEPDGSRVPIHGGPGTAGVFDALNVVWNATTGYVGVPHGSSFVQVVSFTGDGCPDARTILTYSQSSNPVSPYHDDQTRMFSAKQWVTDRFCESAIEADPDLQVQRLVS